MNRATSFLKMPVTDEDYHDELDTALITLNVEHKNSKPVILPMQGGQPRIVEPTTSRRTSTLAAPGGGKLAKAPSILNMIAPPSISNKPKAPRQEQLQQANVMKRNMSVAKGFMDISLFSANANQLRTLLNYGDRSEYTYYIILTGLLLSLALQLISGITLIVNEKFDLEDEDWSEYLNNAIVIQVFFIVIINVFISGFGVNVMSIKQYMITKMQKENKTLKLLASNATALIVNK